MRRLIKGGTIVNEGRTFDGSIVVDDKDILLITEGTTQPDVPVDEVIDASGCFVLPGVIDDHVHFREPGLTEKADIDSESRAAAAGGVTSYFDMPNCVPQTTTLEALEEKFRLAAVKSHVNYSFFFGATNDNSDLFAHLDRSRLPGIKLFMGSSTGNMLVDRREALDRIFAQTSMPVMAHCEDTAIINRRMAEAKQRYGEDPDVRHHPEIRSAEACYESTRLAVELARKHQARLHVAHLTTAKELELFETPCSTQLPLITAETTVSHLYFSDRDYAQLGARIKCNPAIKTERDREALQQALNDGRISVIGTDHAPHLLSQKEGGCARAASGMPMIQFSLVTMLELVDHGVLSLERLVELMCHNPARLFGVCQRGFLRPGYRADLVMVRPGRAWTVTKDVIMSKCGWSPMEGHSYLWQVERTICNGSTVYWQGHVDSDYIGEPLIFEH
ncbi:MAG: dihydroorotase [Prevotella sp.]|nr:dihydroorotase [Prevotella sp.]